MRQEQVYAVIYEMQKQLEIADSVIYQLIPKSIEFGVFDYVDMTFLTDHNQFVYSFSHLDVETTKTCVTDIYSKEYLEQEYPELTIEEIINQILEDAKKNQVIGICANNLRYLVNLNQNQINEDLDYLNDEQKQEIFNMCEQIKKEFDLDGFIITSGQLKEALKLNSSEMLTYLKNVLENNEDIYSIPIKKEDKIHFLSEEVVDDILQCDVYEIKNYITNLLRIEKSSEVEMKNEEILETSQTTMHDMLETDLISVLEDTFIRIVSAKEKQDAVAAVTDLMEFFRSQISELETLGEKNSYLRTKYYIDLQMKCLHEILKLDDLALIKRNFGSLLQKTDKLLSSAIAELSYEATTSAKMEAYADMENEMNKLIGLEQVKEKLMGIVSSQLFKSKTSDSLNFKKENKHMIFTGNPGTGKTTVAEIMSKALYQLGYLRNDRITFASAEDLVAGYVGQTALKTKDLIDENKGGIIVVDEAYILASPAQRFGNEALTVILKEMEKNDTMFIFAGYQEEMEDFVNMNSGLKSRIGTYLHFDDYKKEELLKMFMNRIKQTSQENSENKLTISLKAMKKVQKIIEDGMKEKHFGNGRFVNNLFDMIVTKHAINTKNTLQYERLYKITEEDITDNLLEEILFNQSKTDDSYSNTNAGFNAKLKTYHKN